MAAVESNTDAILIAIPMVGLLFATFFRLDEAFSRHTKPSKNGHPLSYRDKDGHPVCIEPDGKQYRKPAGPSRRD
jgi:hypothetical protein